MKTKVEIRYETGGLSGETEVIDSRRDRAGDEERGDSFESEREIARESIFGCREEK